jgi:hypothetical protein
VANADVQYLGAGDTRVETFTVDSADGTDSQTITVTITGTNDAPVLNTAATPVGVTVLEDAGAPVGAVGTLVSALVDLNPPSGGLDNVTDADNGAVTGIAITVTDSANGTWWYSVNGGANWSAVGAVTDDTARLLASDSNTRVYFQANPDYDGQATLTFRAWDQTSGTNGGTADTTPAGGSSAYSTASDTAVFDITPVIDGTVNITAISSDTGSSSTDFITNDTSLTVSGTNTTLGSGEKIQVSTDGSTWSDVTQNTGTTWSYADPATHSASFTYYARVVDATATVAGSTDIQAVTIDTSAPNAPVIASFAVDTANPTDHITSDNNILLSGTAEANSTVTVKDGVTTLGTATADGSGNWSYQTGSLGVDATHGFTATSTDAAGNTSTDSTVFNVTVDTTIAAPAGLDLAAADDTGTSNTDNVTKNTSSLTITGSGEEGAVVTLFDDVNGNGRQGGGEATLGTGTVSGGTFSIDVSLASGTTHVGAFQTDIAGNSSNNIGSTDLDITVDTVADAAPTTSVVINDVDGFINNAEKAAVSYTLAGIDASTTATVTFTSTGGGTPFVVSSLGNGSTTVDLTSLGDGTISAAVSVTDTAGNTASGTGDTSVKDTVPPAAPGAPDLAATSDSGTSSSDNITNDNTPTFTGTGVNGTTVTILDGVTAVGSAVVSGGTYSITTSALSNAVHSITATTADTAGNVGTSSALPVTIDTTAPTVAITATALGGIGTTSTITFQFSEATTDFAIGDITPTRGTLSSFTAVDADTYTVIFTRTANGAANVTVAAASYHDAAGNNGAAGSSGNLPAGVAGSPINLTLTDPSGDTSDLIAVSVAGIPSDWTLSSGSRQADGTWLVNTSDPGALTVTTPATFAGAMVLDVTMTWTNADGSIETRNVADNVEAYAPGNPIFAVSADDHLSASSAADLLVFAQPIAHDTIHNFDAAADKIDLIGFTGVSGFDNLSIADDANGNAVITLANGSTITVLGVHASDLGAANFEFNVEPVTVNTGTMTIADGAILPLGGTIENSGTIVLGSTGSETDLQILVESATLQGGGQVLLSDDGNNVIFGGGANATLINIDNTISGAGQIGAGQMTLVNAGTIVADGTHALVIDTGGNVVDNSGTLAATGSGGLEIAGAVTNTGELSAAGGSIEIHGNVSGHGSATIGDGGLIDFDAASDANVGFADNAAGTLRLDASADFSGTIVGLTSDDALIFGDIASGASVTYSANASGTAGTLTVSDGTNSSQVTVLGQYSAADFHTSTDSSGVTQVTYDAVQANPTLLGTAGSDVLAGGLADNLIIGGAGSDTLTGGDGSDTFMYRASDGGAVDTITDFDADLGGDVLALGALLDGYTDASSAEYIAMRESGGSTIVSVDRDGAGTAYGMEDLVVLQGVLGLDAETLMAHIDPDPFS